MIRPKNNNALVMWFEKRHEAAAIFLCYLMLPYLFFLKSPISRTILGRYDAFFYSLPTKTFFARSILNGEFPFWNPYNLCGAPFFADMEVGIFYPFNWLFIFLAPEIALNLNIMFHYTLAGFWTFLYLKRLECKKFPAFFGGLAFMFCGFMLAHKGQVNLMQAAAWLPLIMLIFEKLTACDKPNFGLIGCGAIAFSMQIFAGHPQVPVLTGILVLWRLGFHCIFKRHNIVWLVISLLMISALSVGLCCIVIWPVYDFHHLTLRSHMPYGFFAEHSFDPLSLILLIFPYFFGSHEGRLYFEAFWGSRVQIVNLVEYTSYAGFMVYIFSATAFSSCLQKKKETGFYLFTAVFALFMMLGENNPLYRVVYHIPILKLFRSPCRYNLILNFSLAVCASFGLDYLLDSYVNGKQKIKKPIGIVFLFAFSLLFFLFVFSSKAWLYRFLSLLTTSPDRLRVLQSHALSLSFANPAVYIPLLFMTVSLAFFYLPFLFNKKERWYIRCWTVFVVVILFADLFFVGNFLGRNDADVSVIHDRNNIIFMQKALNDRRYRTLLER
ncbi:MAG: YfhO family protein, partial [Proteobacteria bacterium]|nr:YfhO family protein [Pseudomonadota bacterium]